MNSYLRGGHGAGLTPDRHEAIARHLLGVEKLAVNKLRRRRPWFHALHVLSNAIVPLGLAAVVILLGAASGLKGGVQVPPLLGLTIPFWIGWGPAAGFVLAVILIYVLSKL